MYLCVLLCLFGCVCVLGGEDGKGGYSSRESGKDLDEVEEVVSLLLFLALIELNDKMLSFKIECRYSLLVLSSNFTLKKENDYRSLSFVFVKV